MDIGSGSGAIFKRGEKMKCTECNKRMKKYLWDSHIFMFVNTVEN